MKKNINKKYFAQPIDFQVNISSSVVTSIAIYGLNFKTSKLATQKKSGGLE